MYEFVLKKDYGPIRQQLEEIINSVQDQLRDEFTFQFKLIGSGSNHLITRLVGGNQGFDFDYNLILSKLKSGDKWKADDIKKKALNAFRKVVEDTEYNDPQDSTSVITINVVDQKNSRIVHGCDFAIIIYPEEDDSHYYKYIRHNKNYETYTWEIREHSAYADAKVHWIIDNSHWEELKSEYLKIKNANKDTNKPSSSLYLEAISNVYNWYEHFEEEENDDD